MIARELIKRRALVPLLARKEMEEEPTQIHVNVNLFGYLKGGREYTVHWGKPQTIWHEFTLKNWVMCHLMTIVDGRVEYQLVARPFWRIL